MSIYPPPSLPTSFSVPSFDETKQLDGVQNWAVYSKTIIMTVKSCGLIDYLFQNVVRPGKGATLVGDQYFAASQEEFDVQDGWVGAVVYNNTKDPIGEGLPSSMTGRDMFHLLSTMYKMSSELMKGMKEEELCKVKFEISADLLVHLKTLSQLRAEANATGCGITDTDMVAITIQSLPKDPQWSMVAFTHQCKTNYVHLCHYLMEFWMSILGSILSTTLNPNALATQTSPNSGSSERKPKCSNCCWHGHSYATCWDKGSGAKGQAPDWWKHLREHKSSTSATAGAADASAGILQTITGATTIPNVSASRIMETFVMGVQCKNGAVKSVYPATSDADSRCRDEPSPALLTELPFWPGNLDSDSDLLALANVLASMSPNKKCLSYLDSGATDHCVAKREQFLKYGGEPSAGTTAVDGDSGGFNIPGYGVAEIIAQN
jgi:hypothetical protein